MEQMWIGKRSNSANSLRALFQAFLRYGTTHQIEFIGPNWIQTHNMAKKLLVRVSLMISRLL